MMSELDVQQNSTYSWILNALAKFKQLDNENQKIDEVFQKVKFLNQSSLFPKIKTFNKDAQNILNSLKILNF